MRYLLFLFLLFSHLAFSQYVKVVGMSGWTNVKNEKNLPALGETQQVITVGLGIDLLERDSYYLSNEVGYTQLGGKDVNPHFSSPYDYISKKWGYVYASSVFRYKPAMLGNGFVFVGVGPAVKVRISEDGLEDTYYSVGDEKISVNQLVFGLKGELGYMYHFGNYRLGVVGNYTLSTPMAKSNYIRWTSNPIFVGVSFGFGI
ncbi:hypothetical protein [Bergeyella zoohelcum]|uniref:hypothetical protein n=2 Tax=Bergeyella zoohelcum TaxID=1015 RepID=UPI002A910673|nr:hypothetical protein [Bergeyella zoohelcum]MDY6025659.1 hypothetical protein [Bergeyella zoohelcum]